MIKGATDEQGRCSHYHSSTDIIAIKFKCCGDFYACIFCHQELTAHAPAVWQKDEFTEKAILCGHCKTTMSIADYLAAGHECPSCKTAFNPKCAHHYHYYFEV